MPTYTAICAGRPTVTDLSPEIALRALLGKIAQDPTLRIQRYIRCQVWINEEGKEPRLSQDVEMNPRTGEWRPV